MSSISAADYHGQYIYLASPYTHADPVVTEQRYQEARRATSYLIATLHIAAFGAIVFGHNLDNLGMEWEYWAEHDSVMVTHALEVWVLCLPGYTNSMGVQSEIALARKLHKQVRWLVPLPDNSQYLLTNEAPNEIDLYGKVMEGRLEHERIAES